MQLKLIERTELAVLSWDEKLGSLAVNSTKYKFEGHYRLNLKRKLSSVT